MIHEIIFKIANFAVLPAWLLLIVKPHSKVTRIVVFSYIFPFFLGICYLALMIINIGKSNGSFTSLADLGLLFQNPATLLIGWIHYLAFDLMVGSWISQNANQNQIKHVFIIPCLILTLMAGPIGLVVYLIIKWIARKKIIDEII
ncbi:MAG: DUF4281 domain-containing protein [Spirochaetes bacterium]|nr:DUF4281 domain-containing protein [Spirochaetota bacterium]